MNKKEYIEKEVLRLKKVKEDYSALFEKFLEKSEKQINDLENLSDDEFERMLWVNKRLETSKTTQKINTKLSVFNLKAEDLDTMSWEEINLRFHEIPKNFLFQE